MKLTANELNALCARIRRGTAWLNKNKPNWRRSINIKKLRMMNPESCMLGFSFGDYWKVVSRKKVFGETYENTADPKFGFSDRWAVAQGFAAPSGRDTFEKSSCYYEALDAEWRKVLRRIKR